MQAQEQHTTSISVGESHTFEFAGEQPIVLSVDARGTALFRIFNVGRDSVLTISDEAGNRIVRAGGWRGPEHYYYAIVELDSPVLLSIEPDDPVSPAGQIRVRIDLDPDDSRLTAAERAMTHGADLNLAYYYGESNMRLEALDSYLEAARLFGVAGNKARQADALFEAASVSYVLCNLPLTHEQLEASGVLWSELGDEGSLAASENLRGLVYQTTGNSAAAIALFDTASARREKLNDDYFYAESINNLGLVHRDKGDARLAVKYFEAALEIWQGDADFMSDDLHKTDWTGLDRPPWMHHSLTAMNNLAWARKVFGDSRETERILRRALELTEHLSIDFTAATLQNNLGNLKTRMGDYQEAFQLLETALAYFVDVSPNEIWAAQVHFNIAQLHRDLGDRTRAMESLRQSLALRTPECDPIGRAETLKEIAEIAVDNGRTDQALTLIADAHRLLQPYPGNDVIEASLLELEGRAYLSSQRHSDALSKFDDAIRLYRVAGDRYGELTTRTHRARTSSALGRHFAAIAELRAALDLAEKVKSSLESFRVLTALGEVYLADGKPEAALEQARQAIGISEAVRGQLVRPILLRDFASVQRSAYDVLVRAYMSLGQVENAWIASDSGRARRFSDVIRQSDVDLSVLSQEQRSRYQFLMSAISQRAEARTELLARNQQTAADLVLRELLPLIDEMDLFHELARRPGVEADEAVSLSALQSALSANDVVLEYYLGSTISGVWSISADAIAFMELPALVQLTDDIESIATSMRKRQPAVNDHLLELSRNVFGDKEFLNSTKTNLIIIPDGPLHYVPFAALPDPATNFKDPLIVNRTVTYLPSVQALTELRRRESAQGDGIAILADPVFQADDPRVRREEPVSENIQLAFLDRELLRSAERNGRPGFPRLPGTREEARAIEEAAGDMTVLSLYGADANRDIVMSGRLQPFQILHFATHGVLDDEEPALSGIVLSGVTLDGQRRSNFLRSQDIVGISLDAKLVVLSGCETGLGRPVHGEGLLGLSRAFFYAGAEQVISTLWQVPDRATAELMGHFYRALLQEGASAPEALRTAQLAIRNVNQWQYPYYWAPFILQGDWN